MAESILNKALQNSMQDQVKEVEVWENASPDSSFPEQSITVDLSKGDRVKVLYRTALSVDPARYENTAECQVGENGMIQHTLNVGTAGMTKYFLQRTFKTMSNKISFAVARSAAVGSTDSDDNNAYCVPVKIFLIKNIVGGGNPQD